MADYFKELEELNVDAILVADPGVFALARKTVPNMPIHISTQANNTNYMSALFWKNLGATRIVMARELSSRKLRNSTIRLEILKLRLSFTVLCALAIVADAF